MRILPFIAITVIISVIYWPSRNVPYYYDDYPHFVENQKIIKPNSLSDVFFAGTQETRPTYNASLALQAKAFGTNRIAAHFTNIFLHLITGILLFYVLLHFFTSYSLAWSASFLFLLHPIAVESVAYFNSRSGILALFFSFLALFFWNRRSRYSFSLGCLFSILAIGSKEDGVFAATTFSLYLLWKNQLCLKELPWKRLLASLSTLLALPILYLLFKSPHVESVGSTVAPWYHYLWEQGGMIPLHLSQFLYPYPLTLDRDLSSWFLSPLPIFIGWVLLGLLIWGAFRNRHSLSSFGFFWALVALLPTHSVIPILDNQSSRLLYPMLPGMALWLTCIFKPWFRKNPKRAIPVFLCLLVFFGFRTHQQIQLWLNPVALWQKNCEAAPSRWRSWANLAVELADQAKWQEAEDALHRAEQIEPNHYEVLYNGAAIWGLRNDGKQNIPLAIKKLKQVLFQNPNHARSKALMEKLNSTTIKAP